MITSKTLGRTGIALPTIGIGTAFLGYLEGAPPDEALGVQTLRAALDAGCRFFDTAPVYGGTRSEVMIREALAQRPAIAAEVVVTTKAGRLPDERLFDFDGIVRSVYASLERLGRESLELVYIHDAMDQPFEAVMAKDGALGALRHLQKQGVIKTIGTASNDPATNLRYIASGEFDAAVVADAWSLINQTALAEIFPAAEKHKVGLVIATPIERGLLATGPQSGGTFPYRSFSPDVLEHVGKIQDLCHEHGISLLAAALQWIVRHPAVTSVIPGARIPEEATANIQAMQVKIPAAFWDDLAPLIIHWGAAKRR